MNRQLPRCSTWTRCRWQSSGAGHYAYLICRGNDPHTYEEKDVRTHRSGEVAAGPRGNRPRSWDACRIHLATSSSSSQTAYVLGASRPHQRAALLWCERARTAGLLRVEPGADYPALDAIMARYARLPCDYADATLIALAEQTGVTVIATVDQRDFSVYRTAGRKRFRIVLS